MIQSLVHKLNFDKGEAVNVGQIFCGDCAHGLIFTQRHEASKELFNCGDTEKILALFVEINLVAVFLYKNRCFWCLSIDMKYTIRWILVSAVACAICSAVTFSIAFHRGYRAGLDDGLANGSFSESLGLLNALQILQTGDISRATRCLETECFASGKIYYNNPNPDLGKVQLAKALSEYRTNSADWDDWERKLEPQLAKIKSDNEKAWAGIVIKPIDTPSNVFITPSAPPQ
jgi:hypothetical protein